MNVHAYWKGTPRRRQFLRGGLALAAGSAAFALACGGDDDNEQGQATATGGPAQGTTAAATAEGAKRGGRILLANLNTTQSLNPITDSGQRLTLGALHVWDRLVSPRVTRDYVLEAAQSVELPDPTTVVFKLKPGLTFQNRAPVNGRPLDTQDIVKSQEYVRDEPRAGNNAFQRASMESVETPDAQTIAFTLKAPNAYIFSGTQLGEPGAQCIFAKEQIGNLDTAWSVGSGPYEMVEHDLNVRYLYRRFPGFRDAGKGLPYIEEREFRVIADAAAAEAAFRSEQLHIWQAPIPAVADTLKKDLGAKIEADEYLTLAMQTVSANVTKGPPWTDPRVREALYRVTNRKQYLDLILEGKGQVPAGPLPAGLTDYQLTDAQTEKYFKQDPRAGRQLLEAAGFDFNREVEILTITGTANTQSCEILQEQLSTMGVKSRIVALGTAEYLSTRIATGNWETMAVGWPGYDTPQTPLRLHHTQTNHIHQYHGLKDPAIDAMIEKSEVTLDKDERAKLVKDIQIALLDKYTPYIWVYNATIFQMRWKYVRDYETNPATHPMYRTEMWLDK
ncbi:MAG: ABC transporter substrate-binding protein [Dehalococcoidia bacterium]